ncbi:hypothetical protein R3I94_007519 [Phoxinus phoxinus]
MHRCFRFLSSVSRALLCYGGIVRNSPKFRRQLLKSLNTRLGNPDQGFESGQHHHDAISSWTPARAVTLPLSVDPG